MNEPANRHKIRYPHREKTFFSLYWTNQGPRYNPETKRLRLPMGRGTPSIVLKVELAPDEIGAMKLVWNDGAYELHACRPVDKAENDGTANATIDLGEIHQATVVADTGRALIVSGRGIRSIKRQKSKQLGEIAAKGDYAVGEGRAEKIDIRDAYVERLLKDYDGSRDLTVAWDAGNGAAGEILKRLTARLPGKHILLFEDIDGNFPNHHPDPTMPENLVDLQQAVAEHKCDLGIAFDGDGDRIGAVDAGGRIVWGDQLVAIYASEVLKTHPGGTIIADVKASQTLFDEIERLGGKPLMWKTGHSLLKAKMAETGSPLAGEMSGHIFFADKWYGFDDALYCGIRLVALVAKSDKTLAELRDVLPQVFNTPEVRFQTDEERKFAVVKEVKARLAASGATVNDIDGVRVNTEDGWWLLRASNTQDVLVARCEAFSPEGLERLKALLVEQLGASGISAPADF